MCILRFHARAGYLQHYETLLKELNAHPASDPVPPDQYEVERVALADRNLNYLPCESGLRYPSHMVMLSRRTTQSKISEFLSLRLAAPAERWGGFGTCVQRQPCGLPLS